MLYPYGNALEQFSFFGNKIQILCFYIILLGVLA